MTIKAKLFLITGLEVLLVVLVSLVIVVSSRQVRQASSNEVKATEIIETLSELRFVTFENLLHHNERSYEQWQIKYDDLSAQLQAISANSPTEQAALDEISNQARESGLVFNRLVDSYKNPQNQPMQKQLQDRLVSRLLVSQQIQISGAVKLAAFERKQVQEVSQWAGPLVLVGIILLFLLASLNFLYIYRLVTKSLRDLQMGAQAIADGKLDYRIKVKRRDEFGHLANTFNTMAVNLQQVDKMKTEFVMLASHQLRTPATAVKGFISMMLDSYAGELNPKQRDLMAAAYEENERQIHLINNILDAAKVEAGEMVLQPSLVDLTQLMEAAVTEQAPLLAVKDQTIKLQNSKQPLMLSLDTDKIRMLLDNLIDNASKYSPAHSQIHLKLSATKQQATIEVRDHGIGIAPEDLPKLFKRFSRITNPHSIKASGSGLGLYLVKDIVKLHKGHINVTSEVGKGTTFIIQLPIGRTG